MCHLAGVKSRALAAKWALAQLRGTLIRLYSAFRKPPRVSSEFCYSFQGRDSCPTF